MEKPTYICGILIVNKDIPLPKTYKPGLDKKMKIAYFCMKMCALKDGLKLNIVSGFRSYEYQEKIYNEYVKEYGVEKTNTFSAKPGYSEHQSGLAVDICEDSDNFIGTKEDKWLQENAHKFGFIIRYPKGKEHITGYKYEPWHIRYVGKEHARRIRDKNITLEEYLGLWPKS
jgi:D-alanyl-D-alanine carboxypeptidase